MKFKHSLLIRGNNDNIRDFAKQLELLDYKENEGSYSTNGKTELSELAVQEKVVGSGNFRVSPYSSWNPTDFTFNIDNETEYQKALAIAAIREEEDFFPGEILKVVAGGWGIHPKEVGKLVKVGEKVFDRYYYTPLKTFSFVIEKGSASKLSFAKATAEEIIAHFDKQPIKSTTMKELKEGDKVKILNNSTGGRLVVGSIGKIIRELQGIYYVRGQIIEGTIGSDTWSYIKTDLELISDAKITGYKLIKKYPGSAQLGHIERNTLDYDKHPEFYEPIYEAGYKELTLGSNNDVIRIEKGKISVPARNETYSIEFVDKLIKAIPRSFSPFGSPHDVYIGWDVRFIRIGCMSENHMFSIREVDQIKTEYEKLNK